MKQVAIDHEHLKQLVMLAEACTEGSTEHKEHADAITAGKRALDEADLTVMTLDQAMDEFIANPSPAVAGRLLAVAMKYEEDEAIPPDTLLHIVGQVRDFLLSAGAS